MLQLAALVANPASAKQQSVAELSAQVESLTRRLEEANAQLAAAQARETAAKDEPAAATITEKGIQLGPITIGGAMRVNYIYGDYNKVGDAPQRGEAV